MAASGPADSNLLPLLETLEDSSASTAEQTDAYLTIANRLSGEEGKQFVAVVEKHFSRLCKTFKGNISSGNLELSNAALQALGFCVFHSNVASGLAASEVEELLSVLSSIAAVTSDKNTCTRALWVISKQSFSPEVVGKKVPSIVSTVETLITKGDVQSLVIEHEALNVVIRLLEQTPIQMREDAVRWAKVVIPLVVHSAHKVRLKAATALEMGMPLLLQKQQEVASITEQLMTTKLIPELQKLFSTKNETFVLKLWPLFVRLLGKSLHRGGSFINSLLHLEELGFRSGSPVVKKIAFIAWKSLIDNFALNPDILCSSKRLRLLMQPLSSIHVRTEAMALTKLEVWWYLIIRLGAQLPVNFEQVCIPLLQYTLGTEANLALTGTPARMLANQTIMTPGSGQKTGSFLVGSPGNLKLNLSLSVNGTSSLQVLGIEMLFHFFLGPEVTTFAKQHRLQLSLEPLQQPLINSPSFFCKHAVILISAVRDGFIAVGKDTSDAMLIVIWKDLISYAKISIEAGNKERQASEVLTLLLQALEQIVKSEDFPAERKLALIECTVKGLPQKVLGSPAYQVANMDILNGTPALFLILLLFHGNLLECCVTDERYFLNLETLVGYVLSGPTSPLALSEAVLNAISQNASLLDSKEHLWRMWSVVVNPLTERISQTNEVNQGDALEHNFSAMYSALTLPISHLFSAKGFPQPTMKSLLKTWSELYRVFARCAALVATADENVCCEELCAKILPMLDNEVLLNLSSLDAVVHILTLMAECINFSPYNTKCQLKTKSPQTPTYWSKKKREPLGNLTAFFKLLSKSMDSFHVLSLRDGPSEMPASAIISIGSSIISIVSSIFSHLSSAIVIQTAFANLSKPLVSFYENASKSAADELKVYNALSNKLEKLWGDILLCFQSRYTGAYDSELLELLSPLLSVMFLHKSKSIRNQTAQFWNATFAKATTLVYPQTLKPILSQVKQKVPLMLPGFETIEVAEDSSGPYSDVSESSQLGTKISGMEIKSAGKRDSLLARAAELNEKKTSFQATPAKLKLEFSSPMKTSRELLLEEEKSVDFVFIPPEPKQRVLTEHQKEVLRTKSVDIPVMYNNLDASQDTTLFSQSTQSQELVEKPIVEMGKDDDETIPEKKKKKIKTQITVEMTTSSRSFDESITIETEERENDIAKENSKDKSSKDEPEIPAEVFQNDITNEDSANGSGNSESSEVISGTPQKPSSRRQSFITLEKFNTSESRSFSPSALSKFANSQNMVDSEDQQMKEMNNSEELHTCTLQTPLESIADRETKRLSCRQSRDAQSDNTLSDSLTITENESSREPIAVFQAAQDDEGSKSEECIPVSQSRIKKNEPGPEKQNQESMGDVNEKTCKATATDAKENIIPEEVASDSIEVGKPVSQRSLNLKGPRRSSRRRSDVTGTTVDSVDKEEKSKSKDKLWDTTEKTNQRNSSQTEDALLEKKKALPENKSLDSQTNNEEQEKHQRITEKAKVKEEKSSRKKISRAEGGAVDSFSDKESQDSGKGRPRYHTRRSSQGLFSGMEDAQSDSSDIKEDGPKRKRKGRNNLTKSSANKEAEDLEDRSEGKLSAESGDIVRKENTDDEMESKSQSESDKDIVVSQELENSKNRTYTSINESLGASDINEISAEEPNIGQENKTYTDEGSFSRTVVAHQIVETWQNNITYPITSVTTELSNDTVEDYSTATSDVCLPSEKSSLASKCQHKRSKRVRRSKNCDCCGELSQQQVKPFTELKDSKVNDAKKTPLQLARAALENFVDAQLDDSVFVEPCAISTPLTTHRKLDFFRSSISELRTQNELEEETDSNQINGCDDELNRICPKSETDQIPTNQEEPMEQGDKTEQLEGIEKGLEKQDSETVEQSASTERELDKQDDPAEQRLTTENELEDQGDKAVELSVTTEREPEEKIDDSTSVVVEQRLAVSTVVVELEQKDQVCQVVDGQEIDIVHGEMGTDQVQENAEKMSEILEVHLPVSIGVETLEVPTEDHGKYVVSGNIAVTKQAKEEANGDSPQKHKLFDAALIEVNQSPSGMQPRCVWSPSASPSTSILKKGIKRQVENDSPSPVNKIRRVSFADPIYQEGLADDIDRRSPVVRTSSSNSSPTSKSHRSSSNLQGKHITTPPKGFLSPSSRGQRFKSSKKCLISEMSKEPASSVQESVYPALMGCTAPVDIILPQITSNLWARGVGQLVRAKNIKTVGDLCALTAAEIKTLPVRSPKVSTVKRALRVYHEQQMKSRSLEEHTALDDIEKSMNGLEDEPCPVNGEEEKLATDLLESPTPVAKTSTDLWADINALALRFTSEDLNEFSGSQLFAMQEKLSTMMNCIMGTLQSRWRSPPHEPSA
uniref:Replication timing regulatory factor 1 n=1 Tax=Latimeria chalumnae TaxID=7897 RepID=H3A8Z1_LATCH